MRIHKQKKTKHVGIGLKRFKGITGWGTVTSWMPAQWELYAEIEASYSVAAQ